MPKARRSTTILGFRNDLYTLNKYKKCVVSHHNCQYTSNQSQSSSSKSGLKSVELGSATEYALAAFATTVLGHWDSLSSPAWSLQDRACAYCRERKIRCDREKPSCSNCKQDGFDCEYNTPGKRVNHIKLLCNNLGTLEERLNELQHGVSFLVSQKSPSGALGIVARTPSEGTGNFSAIDEPAVADCSEHKIANSHILRCGLASTDLYQGPGTLYALCSDFASSLRPRSKDHTPEEANAGVAQDTPENNNEESQRHFSKHELDEMCVEAAEDAFDRIVKTQAFALPPKPLLLMVLSHFFQSPNRNTDVFVKSSFLRNLERIYSGNTSPDDEAWKICFNIIILLMFGASGFTSNNQNGLSSNSQFSSPFLSVLHVAVHNSNLLAMPKLINVQALTLLSAAAEIYHPQIMAETVLAQASAFARLMGLHQSEAISNCDSRVEALEKSKVARILYISDKRMAMLRGSSCWFPDFDFNLVRSSSGLSQDGCSDLSSQLELAHIQADVYKICHQSTLRRSRSSMLGSSLAEIEKDLDQWALSTELFSIHNLGVRGVHYQLEFLGTRIRALQISSERLHKRQTLIDARASCMLVLIALGKDKEGSLVGRLRALPLTKAPSKALVTGNDSATDNHHDAGFCHTNSSTLLSGEVVSILDSFPMHAFFVLLKNAQSCKGADPDDSIHDDVQFLRLVSAAYAESHHEDRFNNHSRKVGRSFRRLLEIVDETSSRARSASPAPAHGPCDKSNEHSNPDYGSIGSSSLPSGFSIDVDCPTYQSHYNNDDRMLQHHQQPLYSHGSTSSLTGPYFDASDIMGAADFVDLGSLPPYAIPTPQDEFDDGRLSSGGHGTPYNINVPDHGMNPNFLAHPTRPILKQSVGTAAASVLPLGGDTSSSSSSTSLKNGAEGRRMGRGNKRLRG